MGVYCHTCFLSIDPLSRSAPVCRASFSVPYHFRQLILAGVHAGQVMNTPKQQVLHISNGQRWKGPLDQPVLDLHWCTGLTWLARRAMFFKRYCSSEPYGRSFCSLQVPTAHWQRQEASQRWVNSPCLSANPQSSPSISEPNYGNANISIIVMSYGIRS